jgi:hypothetical protein
LAVLVDELLAAGPRLAKMTAALQTRLEHVKNLLNIARNLRAAGEARMAEFWEAEATAVFARLNLNRLLNATTQTKQGSMHAMRNLMTDGMRG